MGALVLLHIVFAGEGFMAGGAEDIFLARVFLAMASGVARGGEGIAASVAGSMRARILLLHGFGGGVGRSGGGGRGGGRGRNYGRGYRGGRGEGDGGVGINVGYS